MRLSRRLALGAVGTLVGSTLVERVAWASLARGLSVAELLHASEHVVVATALAASSSWADFGGHRRMVTDTRVRIEETLARKAPSQSELLVRVLGGAIGNLGVRVDGQAELELGKPSTLFLSPASPILAYVTGAAQGHFPLFDDGRGVLRLRPSPRLPALIAPGTSAAAQLGGKSVPEARDLMQAVLR